MVVGRDKQYEIVGIARNVNSACPTAERDLDNAVWSVEIRPLARSFPNNESKSRCDLR